MSDHIQMSPIFYEVDGQKVQIPAAVYAQGFYAVDAYLASLVTPVPTPEPEPVVSEDEPELEINF